VARGKTHTYVWKVPKRAGPGPMDPSTVLWMYHGHVDELADTNAGLIGP
jgi:manganese oxidase